MAQRKSSKSKLEQFVSKVDQDVLKCPHMVTNLKNDYAKMKPHLEHRYSLPKADQDWMNLYERGCCEKYQNISISSEINITNTCQDIKEAINYVESKINQSTKPSLLLIGEFHSSAESFLMEISILSYLKQKGLANKVLIEFDTNGATAYKIYPISSFMALDARNFAYDVLNYDLVGVDKYHGYSGKKVKMNVREESLSNEIKSIAKNSADKVSVATLGYAHLAPLKRLENNKDLNVITLNIAKPSALERELSGIHGEESAAQVRERYKTIDSIKFVGFRQNLESMTFKQIIDVFQICNRTENHSGTDPKYMIAKGLSECTLLDINDFIGCGPKSFNDEL